MMGKEVYNHSINNPEFAVRIADSCDDFILLHNKLEKHSVSNKNQGLLNFFPNIDYIQILKLFVSAERTDNLNLRLVTVSKRLIY